MAPKPRVPGPSGARVASSIRLVRTQRGMSTYEVERRLKALGHPIGQSGLTRTENRARAISVDDLLAFAVVLNCSPNRMLMPAVSDPDEIVPVVGDVQARAGDLWSWACGERPLIPPGGSPPSGVEQALFGVENQPHRHAG